MMKKILLFLCFLSFSFLFVVPAGAYTIGQMPPAGMAAGAPYILLNAGGRIGYVYPNQATLEYLAVGPDDKLAANLSAVGVPSYNASNFRGTRLYTLPFYLRPDGDGTVSVLACYMLLNTPPLTGQTSYPCSIRWAWLQSDGNLFNHNTPVLIAGDVIVLDTNIPKFSPKNVDMYMHSPDRVLLTVVGILAAVSLLFGLIQQVGRFRKGADAY